MSKLTGKVAVFTGASKGIGAAIAQAMGHRRRVGSRKLRVEQSRADSVVAAITKSGGKALAVGWGKRLRCIIKQPEIRPFGTNVVG